MANNFKCQENFGLISDFEGLYTQRNNLKQRLLYIRNIKKTILTDTTDSTRKTPIHIMESHLGHVCLTEIKKEYLHS